MKPVMSAVREQEERYSQGEERPLRSYAAMTGIYCAAVAALAGAAQLTGRRPERPGVFDTVLIGVATHKLSRLIAKDPVTSPLRAPFTRYEGTTGPAELAEQVRGHGVRHAVGELITCPFCMAQWVAFGFTAGLTFTPRAARLAAAMMTAVASADWLQLAYAWLQQAAGQ